MNVSSKPTNGASAKPHEYPISHPASENYMSNPSSQQSAGANSIDMIAENMKLIADVVRRIFNPSPISTSVQEMIDKTNSKPTIRYMTPEEVMRYIISTHE
jgi:hypothetical protein